MELENEDLAAPAPAKANDKEFAIQVRQLRKVYPSTKGSPALEALKAIDINIPRGSIYGLLGPNGAGKSTFINILAGLTSKTSGNVMVWGFDLDLNPRQVRASLGVVPQELNIDAFFTAREALDLQAGLFGVKRAQRKTQDILRMIHLEDKADSYARTLSGGMRRRLMVGKAMVHFAPILILDEPTAGVDVELRRDLWETMKRLNREGVTIVLTTHYLEEAQALCDRIAIINLGEVVAEDKTSELLKLIDYKTMRVRPTQPLKVVPAAVAALASDRLAISLDAGQLQIDYHADEVMMNEILQAISASGIEIADVSTTEAALEDVFLQLTKGTRSSAG